MTVREFYLNKIGFPVSRQILTLLTMNLAVLPRGLGVTFFCFCYVCVFSRALHLPFFPSVLLSFPTGHPLSVFCLSGCLSWCCCSGEDRHLRICRQWLSQLITMPRLSDSPSSSPNSRPVWLSPNCRPVWLFCVLLGFSAIHTHAKDGKKQTTLIPSWTDKSIICNAQGTWRWKSSILMLVHMERFALWFCGGWC